MINLIVSEAYAFDYLAILFVKQEHGISDHIYTNDVTWQMREDVGDSLFEEVLVSQLFHELVEANHQVWNLVAKAAKDECKASEVDQANQRRYAAKKALQERFWPTQPLVETKSERPT